MKKIKLVMERPFPTNVDINIIDVTEGKERRRGGLTAEYAKIDLKPVLDRGGSLEDAMQEIYRNLNIAMAQGVNINIYGLGKDLIDWSFETRER